MNETKSTALAAGIIFLVFLVAWIFIPDLVLWVADLSPWLGVLVAAIFVLAFPAIFWLRSRHLGKKRKTQTGSDRRA